MPFDRTVYQETALKPKLSGNIEIDIIVDQAGAFEYRVTYDELTSWNLRKHDRQGSSAPRKIESETWYFVVDPALMLNRKHLPLDGIVCQSTVAKWMGPVTAWDYYLNAMNKRNYNMVHFTPLQVRGASNSPYSIFNQLDFSEDLFDEGVGDRVEAMREILHKMEHEYNLLSLTDVVWNHTAHNSAWLQEHPEAGYNLHNSPHLTAAYELDTSLLAFSGKLAQLNLPTKLNNTHDLLLIMDAVKVHVFGAIRLWEFYIIDVERDVELAVDAWTAGANGDSFKGIDVTDRSIVVAKLTDFGLVNCECHGKRYHRQMKPETGGDLICAIMGPFTSQKDTTSAKSLYESFLEAVNLPLYRKYDDDCEVILEQLYNRTKYVRLDDNGPRLGEISKNSPLIETYFTRIPVTEISKKHPEGSLCVANNGWIWANNPLEDFAGPGSSAYLRREVIVWGDCVKLRYGKGPEDNPWLWSYMKKYTKLMASMFHGFRIDNCHSTPLPVASYLLDAAREARPNIYVMAELFTGSEQMDVVFVSRLGISSLIREAMQAWDAQELSRLVHRHGGRPIGSLDRSSLVRSATSRHVNSGEKQILLHPVSGSDVNPIFMDCTHDNEAPAQKRVAQDALPTAALVTMCASAVGSVWGFDELYPCLLELVTEKRRYKQGDMDVGIAKVKSRLNELHQIMAQQHFSESHVHHENEYITIHRFDPKSHKGYLLIAHTAFHGGEERGNFGPIVLQGTQASAMFSCHIAIDTSKDPKKDTKELRGFTSKLEDLELPKIDVGEAETTITIGARFPPGSIALIETSVKNIDADLMDFIFQDRDKIACELNLNDLNVALYRASQEERDSTAGVYGPYNIPGVGENVYCGLQGWHAHLKYIVRHNDLAHPLCQHLREGNWAFDYVVGRLEAQSSSNPRLTAMSKWFEARFIRIRKVPMFLHPKLFALVILIAYFASVEQSMKLMSAFVQDGTDFVKQLALVSVQVNGTVNSASLVPNAKIPSLAAGLPHFATEYMRTWGRDTFISFRGLFLTTGRYEDAESHLLSFASVVKHGLMPNLLDSGRRPRYNARDAVWFYLQSLQDFVQMAPSGSDILTKSVKRRFQKNDTFVDVDDSKAYSERSTIVEIVHEIMQKHAQGIQYREAYAGPSLDSQMTDEGFNVVIQVDWQTGFIHGGNVWNCGTWQDKMGSSAKAGNKGIPATPRNGAPVELTGLLKSALRWILELKRKQQFNESQVSKGDGTKITYEEWNNLIQNNFERCYYIPLTAQSDEKYDVISKIINRRGIYKDICGSSKPFEDYQLRANFPVSMTVAPELFKPEHALDALASADEILRGPVGMKTLDPSDNNYRGYYDNSNDSDDYTVAAGFCYHQGPEWVWLTGYFLRALLIFNRQGSETLQQLHFRLQGHRQMIETSPWAGLVELTNKDGAPCPDSCDTQAWSAATILGTFEATMGGFLTHADLLYDALNHSM